MCENTRRDCITRLPVASTRIIQFVTLFFSQCRSRYVQLNNVRLLSYNVHNGARVTHENNFAGAKNAVKHTWLVFEVKLWVVREMINRRAGKIRGRERERQKAGERGGRKKNNESEGGKRISREDTLNGEKYTSAFSPSCTQTRIASSSRNV